MPRNARDVLRPQTIRPDREGEGREAARRTHHESKRRAPFQERQQAPDFELAYAGDAERTFRLSEHRARPVALIFGSYT